MSLAHTRLLRAQVNRFRRGPYAVIPAAEIIERPGVRVFCTLLEAAMNRPQLTDEVRLRLIDQFVHGRSVVQPFSEEELKRVFSVH